MKAAAKAAAALVVGREGVREAGATVAVGVVAGAKEEAKAVG